MVHLASRKRNSGGMRVQTRTSHTNLLPHLMFLPELTAVKAVEHPTPSMPERPAEP